MKYVQTVLVALTMLAPAVAPARGDEPNPMVMELGIPAPEDSAGGILVADVNDNGKPDFLVTVPGHPAVFDNGGRKLWVRETDLVVGSSSESHGLPGHHGPGVAAGDLDSDGRPEVMFLTKDHVLHVVDGAGGVEVIHTIDWTGQPQQLACAKERHTEGDGCLFEPLTGRFVERFEHRADRLYVADVSGDWREEIIVLDGSRLVVHRNPAPNPRPNQKRHWEDRNYRRLKQCHNYYSP